MRRLSLALALLAATALPAAAAGPEAVAGADRVVAVWGEGEAHAKPDMAELSAGVVTEGRSAHDALSANSQAMERVIATVKALGIEGRDLQTEGVNLNPVYARSDNSGAPPHIASYRAQNTLRIRLHDLGKLGTLLDKVAGAGANTENGLLSASRTITGSPTRRARPRWVTPIARPRCSPRRPA